MKKVILTTVIAFATLFASAQSLTDITNTIKEKFKLIKDKEGLVTINKIESKKTIPKEKLSKKEDKLIDINPELKEEKTNALPEVEVSKEDKPSDDNPELKEE